MSDLDDDAYVIAKFLYDNKNIGAKYVAVSQLKEELNLAVEDFESADFYLCESHYCNGTMGGDSGGRTLTAAGVTFVKTRADRITSRELPNRMSGQPSTIDIFISHSSQDAGIVQDLITLLRSALNIPASHIRCTSVEGYNFDAGVPFDDQLRIELRESKLFLALLTPASIGSTYVLLELGARWGANLSVIPLLAAGATSLNLQGPLMSLNALKCDVTGQVHQLIDQIARALNLQRESPSVYQKYIEELIGASKSAADRQATQAQTAPTHESIPVYIPQPKGRQSSRKLTKRDFDAFDANAREPLESLTSLSSQFLVIHTALYGAKEILKDVTALVHSKASSRELKIRVSNKELGGDPIHGEAKTLVVVYSYDGRLLSKQQIEGEELSLP